MTDTPASPSQETLWTSDRERLEAKATPAQLALADAFSARLSELGHHDYAHRRALLLDLALIRSQASGAAVPSEPTDEMAWKLVQEFGCSVSRARSALAAALAASPPADTPPSDAGVRGSFEFTDDEWWDAYGVDKWRDDAHPIDCVREAIREIAARRTRAALKDARDVG